MKSLLFGILLSVLCVASVHALPILPQDRIVTGTSGAWEWVWIAPCAPPDGFGCSLKPGVEAYGFSAPTTTAQWTESFAGYLGMFNAFIDFTTRPFATTRCSATFFSQEHTVCHAGDLQVGAIWLSPFAPPAFADFRTSPSAESFWVRAAATPQPVVPVVPASVPEGHGIVLLMLGLSVVGCAFYIDARRSRLSISRYGKSDAAQG